MYGTFTVVVGFEYGLVDESVAIPFVFVGVHFGKVDGHFYQVAEHVRLGSVWPSICPIHAAGRSADMIINGIC